MTPFGRDWLSGRFRYEFDEQLVCLALKAVIHDTADGFPLCIDQSVSGDDSESSFGSVQAPLGRASIMKPGYNLLPRVAALGKTHCAIAVVIEVLRQVAADCLALNARALVFDLQPERV